MKIKVESKKVFRPVEVTIVCENESEFLALLCRSNVPIADCRRAMPSRLLSYVIEKNAEDRLAHMLWGEMSEKARELGYII